MGGSAEPWFAPVWRFARAVMLIDLLLCAVVAGFSVWNGWTSVEDSSTAILVGGIVLSGSGVLPFVLPLLEALPASQMQPRLLYPEPKTEVLGPGMLRISALLTTAGLLAIAYALAVKTLCA